ncbi:DUF2259 domain-containing protein [Deinococcus petrolearius]|uniref:DUF2259 domain-containing protein n=1 Tax=Deinococcus petrolearius TaxID=1751295 RepID=A0ABW1DHH9_9DEIO
MSCCRAARCPPPTRCGSGSSRTCAARFRLGRMDVRGHRMLLTVRAYRPGFEGPDAPPMFVAARLR